MKKIISMLLIVIMIIGICSISQATTLGGIISGADGFINKAETEEIDQNDLKNLSNTIYNVLLVLAIVASLIVGALIGIKLITSGAEGKADMKQALAPYVVGNVVVFGAFGIWKLVVSLLNTIA